MILIVLCSYYTHLVQEVPLPPQGKVRVSLPVNDVHLLVSRPPLNCLNNIRAFSLYPLFATLSIDDVVLVWEHVMAECKVLVVSRHLALLNTVLESLALFLFPLYWQHVYIPVLPASMWNFIHAPVPYMIGVHADCKSIELIPSDVRRTFNCILFVEYPLN